MRTNNPKPTSAVGSGIRLGAPPVYRPAAPTLNRISPSQAVQQKTAAVPRTKVIAPPVYRPKTSVLLQPKPGFAKPHVYRPQHTIQQHKIGLKQGQEKNWGRLRALFGHTIENRAKGDTQGMTNGTYTYVVMDDAMITSFVPNALHGGLSLGADVDYAGTFKIWNGRLEWWSNASGHYRPPSDAETMTQSGFPAWLFVDYRLLTSDGQNLLDEADAPRLHAAYCAIPTTCTLF
jgi:hypothetical protein